MVSVTKHGTQTLKGPKLIHGYTLFIGPETWLSTMSKRRMYRHPPQIRTSAFYHRLSVGPRESAMVQLDRAIPCQNLAVGAY